jgi:hypothetical protein
MPSFILRNLDAAFWTRVQAKAAAEGSTVKAVILRLLAAWLAAVVVLTTLACGYKAPTAPTPAVQPPVGVPARLELTANPGVGTDGGTGTVVARVFDAFSTALPDQTVTFSVSEGALSAAKVVTDDKGIARTTLTGPAGAAITIHASAGDVDVETLIAIQPTPAPPPVPPAPVPPPPLPEPPAPPPGIPTYVVTLSASPSSLLVGGTATLSASVIPLFRAPAPTAYAWDCTGDSVVDATTSTASYVCAYPIAGSVAATVRVTGGAASALGTTTVSVTPPVPPTPPALTLTLTGSPQTVAVTQPIAFTATIANVQAGETVSAYQWDLDNTAGFEGTSTITTRPGGPYTVAGLFVATVKVTTSTGRTASATFNYVVTN